MINRLFSYLFTPTGQGIGTSNLAYNPVNRLPQQSPYNPRYNVRGQLAPTAPAFFKASQSVPMVSIEGNGLALQGQMALQSLVDLQNEAKEKADKS